LLALCGCSGTDILNFTVPRTGYSVYRDIAYGKDPRQHLDVYVPDKPATNAPVLMFFYGGSWQWGDKKDYLFVGEAFASKGFITVIADYRVYPQVYFPDFMYDAANAFVWTHKHIKEYGGNPDNIFVSGHSAGAYLALMLTVNDSYLKMDGGKTEWIKGTVGMAGPYDFLPFTDPKIKEIFSKRKDEETQPVNYVKPRLPPILLITGDKDTDVFPRNTIRFAAALRKSGNNVTEHIYPDLAHIGIILSLARGFRSKSPALEDITEFVAFN
jgi:acetyl esterase/lipase